VDADVGFACYYDVGMFVSSVGEEVESEDYGSVGGVFEGDDAIVGFAGLDRGEDVLD